MYFFSILVVTVPWHLEQGIEDGPEWPVLSIAAHLVCTRTVEEKHKFNYREKSVNSQQSLTQTVQ